MNRQQSASNKLLVASLHLTIIEDISFLLGSRESKSRDILGRMEEVKSICLQHTSWLLFVRVDCKNEGFEISLVKSIEYAIFLREIRV